jgi:hypothetical protein
VYTATRASQRISRVSDRGRHHFTELFHSADDGKIAATPSPKAKFHN